MKIALLVSTPVMVHLDYNNALMCGDRNGAIRQLELDTLGTTLASDSCTYPVHSYIGSLQGIY